MSTSNQYSGMELWKNVFLKPKNRSRGNYGSQIVNTTKKIKGSSKLTAIIAATLLSGCAQKVVLRNVLIIVS